MKLVRKNNTPVIVDEYGIQHPNLTLGIVRISEDKLNKKLLFVCSYYHTRTCQYKPLYIPEVTFNFSNEYTNENPGNNGYPTYTEVKQDIEIDDDGNLIPLNEDMGEWILNQPFILDLEGKKFIDNWEIIP
jgi:hypothetical protein